MNDNKPEIIYMVNILWDLICKSKKQILLVILLLLPLVVSPLNAQDGFWIRGDFHMHTTMSDADNTPAELAENAFNKFGLDAIAISEHGGLFFAVNNDFQRVDEFGNLILDGKDYDLIIEKMGKKDKSLSRSIQLVKNSFPEILKLRKVYPDKLIIQGLEWNIPGHGHGSIGILSESAQDISNFHYMFDRNDKSYKGIPQLKKQSESIHENALKAIKYLENNYPDESYFIVNHPSRSLKYTVADFRDFNNTSATIAIGFEGFPGHQKFNGIRGEYGKELGDRVNYHSKTYGGADFMLAKVGGLWDALLGEGRNFWVFANSDYHRTSEDFWPGEYTKSYINIKSKDYKSLIQGMRSGNVFIVTGDLISELKFTAKGNGGVVVMGKTLEVEKGAEVEIRIGFKSPSKNNNGDAVNVDHIDLISGEVQEKIKPDSDEYNKPVNSSTKILKRFTNGDWEKADDGLNYVSYFYKAEKSEYFRLRGTNLPLNTANETDENGNPLCDELAGENNKEAAWKDLWFYSNPIFIKIVKQVQ